MDTSHLLFLVLLFTANIANAQQVLTIGEIQGEQLFSEYIGETVRTENAIITFQDSDLTIIQSAAGMEDGSVLTSDAMIINDGISESEFPAGTTLNITGKIIDIGQTAFSKQDLLIEKVADQSLPEAISLVDFFSQDIAWTEEVLERIEYMLVNGDGGMVTEPSDQFGRLSIYFTEDRPMREPGISAPGVSGLPEFDNNLESINHIPLSGNNPSDVPAGSILSSTGYFLSIDQESYLFSETFNFQLPEVLTEVPTPPSSFDEDKFTIASCNLLVFDASDFDFPPRLKKMVDYIHTGLGLPDVIGIQEVADLTSLVLLKNELNDSQDEKVYTSYLEGGNNSFISSGFLVSDRIEVEEVKNLGGNQSFSLGGPLHDRPPLYLKGTLKTNPAIPFSILNLHLRSLSGIEGSNQTFVRKKRWEQSVSVANIIESIYDENLFILGDFNAYPFSDGYVDVFHQIQGGSSEGAERAVLPVNYPPLASATALLPKSEQYSFLFDGHTQQLDHLIYTPLDDLSDEQTYFYHENSNNPDDWVSRSDRPAKVSDHDGLLFAMAPAHPWEDVVEIPMPLQRPFVQLQNPFPVNGQVTFFPSSGDIYRLKIYDSIGRLMYEEKSTFINNLTNFSFSPVLNDNSGLYYFQILGQEYEWAQPVLIIR